MLRGGERGYRVTDSEFDRLVERQGVPSDQPSTSAELDTRRSKSALGPNALGGGAEGSQDGHGHYIVGWSDNDEGPILSSDPPVATPHPAQIAGAGGGSDIV